jgi:hypothetical protein
MPGGRPRIIFKYCLNCGKLINRKYWKFCDWKCRNQFRRKEKICLFCGKDFTVALSEINKGGGKYCSPNCYHKSRKGIKGKYATGWKGGKYTTNRRGFKINYIYFPSHPRADKDGYVKESILSAEKKLGRIIKKTEVVHHIDNDPSNNDLKNLFVFRNNSEHIKFHNTLKKLERNIS